MAENKSIQGSTDLNWEEVERRRSEVASIFESIELSSATSTNLDIQIMASGSNFGEALRDVVIKVDPGHVKTTGQPVRLIHTRADGTTEER